MPFAMRTRGTHCFTLGRNKHHVSLIWAVSTLVVFALGFAALSARGQENQSSEYALKAAFLYNFAKFIDWPPASFPNPDSPFTICIFGVDPFGAVIDNTLRGKTIGDHPVALQRIKDLQQTRHCQILFVSSVEKRPISEIVSGAQGANVLIVGESDRFAESGGAIQLMVEQGHIRFAINTDAAENAGLRVSSKLLALAKVIRGTETGRN